ncbi:hypothetical protein AB1L30_01250 [Bremerella sp. JC817]|uniref:hypothetical protein n=1 Tax=Bremerella sp. JC817 TaxID=3231756 RepID=UPI0034588863
MQIYEVTQSQAGKDATGKGSNRKLLYHVIGSDDDATIAATVASVAPAEFVTPFKTLKRDDISKTQIGPAFWAIEVNYIDPDKQEEKKKPEVGTLVASWDTMGGSQHITVSLETVDKAGKSASELPPDFKRAIEVAESGVNGTDVVVGGLKLDYEFTFPFASVTDAYIRKLDEMTGTTNATEWKGWAAGRLLFLGSSGRQTSQGQVTARFSFRAGQNREVDCAQWGLVEYNTGEDAVLTKKAHDHLWFYFKKYHDENAKQIVHRPVAAYVERLYEPSNFAELAIGT